MGESNPSTEFQKAKSICDMINNTVTTDYVIEATAQANQWVSGLEREATGATECDPIKLKLNVARSNLNEMNTILISQSYNNSDGKLRFLNGYISVGEITGNGGGV